MKSADPLILRLSNCERVRRVQHWSVIVMGGMLNSVLPNRPLHRALRPGIGEINVVQWFRNVMRRILELQMYERISRVWYSSFCPTDPFTILKPQDQGIGESNVLVQERRANRVIQLEKKCAHQNYFKSR